MTKSDETKDVTKEAPAAGEGGAAMDEADEAGDAVEQAGETTAAALTGGDDSADRPVGAGTLVEVEGDPRPECERA
jgi:hypothetical protein